MLNEFLDEILDEFKVASVWYSKGIYQNFYPEDVMKELDNICNRVRILKQKLETENFKGSYTYTDSKVNP